MALSVIIVSCASHSHDLGHFPLEGGLGGSHGLHLLGLVHVGLHLRSREHLRLVHAGSHLGGVHVRLSGLLHLVLTGHLLRLVHVRGLLSFNHRFRESLGLVHTGLHGLSGHLLGLVHAGLLHLLRLTGHTLGLLSRHLRLPLHLLHSRRHTSGDLRLSRHLLGLVHAGLHGLSGHLLRLTRHARLSR